MAGPGRDISLWQAGYVQTCLERDVRTMRQVSDPSQVQVLLRALTARSAQPVNLTGLARDPGAAVNTVKAWLSVLEATHRVIALRPYSADIGKTLVKTPRVCFTDTGTLCYLTGLKDPGPAAAGPLCGAVMETAVLFRDRRDTDPIKGAERRAYFWRTSAGAEMDIVVETADGLVPVEVKLSATPDPSG